MSTARDRRKKRKQREKMAERASSNLQQALPQGKLQSLQEWLPAVNLPGGRWWIIIPAALLIILGVTFSLGLLNPPENETAAHAMWLDDTWTYDSQVDIEGLTTTLQQHNIGRVFAYVSSLKEDNTWSGQEDGLNRFNEIESQLEQMVQRFKAANPNMAIYAWVEVIAAPPGGYRLDSPQVQNTVALFSERMVERLGFDGVLLDVKPIFAESEDYLSLLTTTRAQLGLDIPLVVAVPPDLTPADAGIVTSPLIAPGTQWSTEYKQRVALKVDMMVVNAYNSYLDNAANYINWVTYQVDTYSDALSDMGTRTQLLISVANFADNAPAHDATVESMAAGLDGVRRGRLGQDANTLPYIEGVAIYTDRPLTDDEWRVFDQKVPATG